MPDFAPTANRVKNNTPPTQQNYNYGALITPDRRNIVSNNIYNQLAQM